MEPTVGPPQDAEDWSDDQWLTWLMATDSIDDALRERDGTKLTATARIVQSAGGQVLGSAMLGLANALYGPKDDEVVIVEEASEPEPDDQFTIHLDPEHPERSSVVFKGSSGRQDPEQTEPQR